MKAIGLLGGTSWESTAVYYQILNQMTKAKVGETHSCPILLYSFDFEPIRQLSFSEDWAEIGRRFTDQAVRLEAAGAECILICANTLHRFADDLQSRIRIPVISLIEAVGAEASDRGMKKIAVLGTRYTMEGDFYSGRLATGSGLRVVIPDETDKTMINAAIYDELVLGKFLDTTRDKIAGVIAKLATMGAEGVVLGCTELPMLLRAEDSAIPMLDTTAIHCAAAIKFALSAGEPRREGH